MNRKIGITTTIPVEVVYAAGNIPIDLNNIFITSADPSHFLEIAENSGFPRNMCNWVKGIYGVATESDIKDIIAVVEGDCSNTNSMVETLQYHGSNIIPFAYPYDKDKAIIKSQIDKLIHKLGTSFDEVMKTKQRLDKIRKKLILLDEMTWRDNLVLGSENHIWLVSSSDFNSDPVKFENELDAFISTSAKQKPFNDQVRLGLCGVPPIFKDLYTYLESKKARVVFNETQRQFSMPFETDNIIEQYYEYTYPYDIFGRIKDIKNEIKRRNIKGLIHYVQSFCHRQIEDIILREEIDIPIITLEGERPADLDARTRLRLDTFIEMLS